MEKAVAKFASQPHKEEEDTIGERVNKKRKVERKGGKLQDATALGIPYEEVKAR